jgi:hypothetical protein
MEVSDKLHAPAALPPGKEHRISLGGPPKPVCLMCRRKTPLVSLGIQTPDRPARTVHYPGSYEQVGDYQSLTVCNLLF